MQQNNLKALSVAVLQRNQQRNKRTTEREKPCNNSTEKQPHLLRGVVPQLRTFDEAHDALNSLGNWQQIAGLAAELCPSLLDAAKQANRDVDKHVIGIGHYYQAWLAIYRATQSLSGTLAGVAIEQ